jgi:GNAT superfamily N-acetyltransferase
MNIIFRTIGEWIERIVPHRWPDTTAKKPRRRKVQPRPLHPPPPDPATLQQHVNRRPAEINLKREGIWIGEACVGEFVSDHALVTPEFVLNWARHSRNLTRYVKSLPLPPEFTWFYVDILTIHAEWRGQGISKAVFNKIAQERKPVLFMLIPQQPHAIGWGASIRKKNAEDKMSQARRLAIYQNLGFQIIRIKNRHFGKGAMGFRFEA